MAIPNMAMIPSGYKPTKLYSVLPTPSYGSEEITNGDFSNGSTDWGIEANGTSSVVFTDVATLNIDGSNNNVGIYQENVFSSGKGYKVSVRMKASANFNVEVLESQGAALVSTIATNIALTTSYQDFTFYHTAIGTNDIFVHRLFSASGANESITIDNVSVQEVLVSDADFDVSRASSATRVNAQGLIETPEFIVSDELVTNGDFSDGSTGWQNLNANASIVGGKLECDNVVQNVNIATQLSVVPVQKQIKLTYDVVINSGSFRILLGDSGTSTIVTTSGTYTFYETSGTGGNLNIQARTGGFDGSIDNISVVQVERENIPRLDYTDGGCPVLLTEPQSTNLITHSEDFSDSYWTKTRLASIDGGFSSPSADSPLGAFKMVEDTSNATHLIQSSLSFLNAKYSLSAFVKADERNWIKVNLYDGSSSVYSYFDLTNGVVGQEFGASGKIENYGNGWYKCSISSTSNVSIGNGNISIRLAENNGGVGYTGDGTSGVYIFGAQLEQLSYATSYMPTYGAISSRASETITNAGDVNTFNSTEGVLFVEIENSYPSATNRGWALQSSSNDGSDLIAIRFAASQKIIFYLRAAGVTTINQNVPNTYNGLIKIALKYKSGENSLWINGVEVHSNTTAFSFNNAIADLSNYDGLGNYGHFKTSQVQVFNTALSDYELRLLTGGEDNYDSYEEMRLVLNYNIQ